MAAALTRDQIDAISIPHGWKAGPRPIDVTQRDLEAAAGSFAPRVSEYLARNADTGRRMVAACAARHGWTQAQADAANSVYLLIPVDARKGKTSRGALVYEVLVAAAATAVSQ